MAKKLSKVKPDPKLIERMDAERSRNEREAVKLLKTLDTAADAHAVLVEVNRLLRA
jgi:hypothetical protein